MARQPFGLDLQRVVRGVARDAPVEYRNPLAGPPAEGEQVVGDPVRVTTEADGPDADDEELQPAEGFELGLQHRQQHQQHTAE
jgi:hypothetical protein